MHFAKGSQQSITATWRHVWIQEHLELHVHQIVKQEESAAMVMIRGQEGRQGVILCALMQIMMVNNYSAGD